jgi:hypothetical protein
VTTCPLTLKAYTEHVTIAGLGLLAAILAIGHAPPNTEHIGFTSTDRLLVCARDRFGLPVFGANNNPLPQDTGICPPSAEAVTDALAKQRLRIVLAGDAVYVIPERLFEYSPILPYVKWKRLKIKLLVVDWRLSEGSRHLSQAEREHISGVIYGAARTPLVEPVYEASPDREATLEISLALLVHAFKGRHESVIGVWGREMGARRIVYGEIVNGSYRLLWDSPLLNGAFIAMRYDDVDGDGVDEIIVSSRYGRRRALLTIFDTLGHELTRQSDCVIPGLSAWDAEGGVCPISGEDMTFEPGTGKAKDIVVDDWNGQRRFRLHERRYVKMDAADSR